MNRAPAKSSSAAPGGTSYRHLNATPPTRIRPGVPLCALLRRFAELHASKDDLLSAADARRSVLKEFWERFDALDARTKASLAGSWRIFGRVVARKTLVDLNSGLDEIRREFARLPAAGSYDHDALGPVTAGESSLAASLEINEAALTRSQGAAWVKQSRADVAQLKALQDRLVTLDAKRRDAEGRLTRNSQSLIALVNAAAPAVMAAAPPVTARSRTIDAPPSQESQPALTPVLAAHGALGETSELATETTSRSDQKPERFGWIFWISIGVLAILLWVSIRTVLSVVEPVRRIRSATLRIAGGETAARVTRGGIRELDDLAVSFNKMAEQLADAKATTRNYQEQLEARVKLRTRELRHLAEHDPLTLLPNRRQLFTHLKAAVAQAAAGASAAMNSPSSMTTSRISKR